MKLTKSLQDTLERIPLAGANVLVDAFFEDREDATSFNSFLRSAVGSEGTAVLPTFTDARTLSSELAEPVPFHSDLEVNPDLGQVAEIFRRHPGSMRSGHPTNSFAACGPRGHVVLSTNRDNNPLGPIKKLNLMNGISLRVGQPMSRCTPLHLAEVQALPGLHYKGTAKRINVAGFEERVVVEHVATCTAGFDALEESILSTAEPELAIHSEGVHFIPLRELVRAAVAAIKSTPERLLCGRDDCRTCLQRISVLNRSG